ELELPQSESFTIPRIGRTYCIITVELVVTQFRRAKGRVDAPDAQLFEDISSLYSCSSDTVMEPVY
ncbi:U-box domain-containing protein 13, partial [Bienertia sinuspersici]